MSPVMPGHSDECAACRWEQLPDEDRQALDEAAFREHSRAEPPPPPQPMPRRHKELAAGGAIVSVFLLALGFQVPAFWWLGAVAGFGAAVYVRGLFSTQESYERAWQAQRQRWKSDQMRAWLAARAAGQVWPCPTCGSLTCSTEHTVTTGNTIRVGRFYSTRSRTDPV